MTKRRKLLAFTIVLLLSLGILLSLRKITGGGLQPVNAKEGDYLIYVVSPRSPNSQFMLYDPAKNTHVPILSDWNIRYLRISPNGRLAFSSLREGGYAIYVLDYPFTNSTPINIIGDTATENFRMAWSPDGRDLAYSSLQGDVNALSIWDGESSTPIFNSPNPIGDITWSPDSRLAFTASYKKGGSEVFIWDGDETVNLSQNPTGKDHSPAWNVDGRLAFLSEQAGVYDIFIWDGISTIIDIPDINSYTNLSSPLIRYNSRPVWSNSGSLTFYGQSQIYEWNGKDTTNISQNPGFINGDQHWRGDEYWSFDTYFSNEQLIYIRDEKNKTRLTLEGYGVRWSESGYFIFCQRTATESYWHYTKWELPRILKGYDGWTLLLGNGSKITEIVQGNEIEAIWANGEPVICTGS